MAKETEQKKDVYLYCEIFIDTLHPDDTSKRNLKVVVY